MKNFGKQGSWWRLVGVAGLSYVSICLSLYLSQERMIFEPQAELKQTPADRNLAYQEVSVPVKKEGTTEKLSGWWLPAQGKTIGTILYLHGRGGNIGSNIEPAYHFTQRGFAVLLLDYRGYGKSQGSFPFEQQIYADSDAAWTYLTQTRKIAPRQIAIYGHALGGAVAIELARKHQDLGSLVVQSSFTSMSAMAERAWWSKLVPTSLLLNQKFDSIAKVRSLKSPVLYIHGTADRLIPAEMSRALYTATPTASKQIILVANGNNLNTSPEFNAPEQLETITQFIKQSLSRG